ncbi:M20/M25/M40 family metallo-hydrolase [Phenylobacterium sp. J426]|uniref:M20/M25/M40 family metallo-hydrolase n=1 Tax=Phenylobacterium sp. J426 TaxID=2898439 RepID=UPI0021515BB6|nr:M20/M25/M40 family metallo-hydrolase [Phenylobacterium sp. J426]MCR5875491.1 M20/M25/M40 family metallo-hydrolase [Phenylobacterium sp. J426]
MIRTLLVSACVAAVALPAVAAPPPGLHDQALEILTTGVRFRTVNPGDQMVPYADYLKSVLVKAGYRPDEITIRPMAGTAALIARYPGSDRSKKPIVILGHMDVVEAKREDWERDPFKAVVENGYVYGRGAEDNKFDVSMVVATLAQLRREGWKPGREVILALSGDEETKMVTTQWLANELKGAEFALNADGGGGTLDAEGKPVAYGLQAAEKTYADFTLTLTDPGGHSSAPTPGNPIYRMSQALKKLDAYRFPVMANEITRASAAAMADKRPGAVGQALKRFAANPQDPQAIATLSADKDIAPQLRTTCVATMISGGHAPNALPQRAEATVNCRIFPGTPAEEVRKTLDQVMAEPGLTVARVTDDGSVDSPASPLRPDVMAAVKKAVNARYPGLPVTPSMSSGATDSMHFRALGVPSYGVSGLFMRNEDSFAHGLNERAPVAAIDGSLDHWRSLLKDLAK